MSSREKAQSDVLFDLVAEAFYRYKRGLVRDSERHPGVNSGIDVPISDEAAAILAFTHVQALVSLQACELPEQEEDGSPVKVVPKEKGYAKQAEKRMARDAKKAEQRVRRGLL